MFLFQFLQNVLKLHTVSLFYLASTSKASPNLGMFLSNFTWSFQVPERAGILTTEIWLTVVAGSLSNHASGLSITKEQALLLGAHQETMIAIRTTFLCPSLVPSFKIVFILNIFLPSSSFFYCSPLLPFALSPFLWDGA